ASVPSAPPIGGSGYIPGFSPGTTSAGGASGSVVEDSHANRSANYSPATIGNLFYETDRFVLYIVIDTGGGALAWEYAAGTCVDVVANRPADLGTTDKGFAFY